MAALQRHFDDQLYNYGDQVIVNLVSSLFLFLSDKYTVKAV